MCSKVRTLAILYGLSANALEQKVFESPQKVQKMRQMMTARAGMCPKQGAYVRVGIGSIQVEKSV